MQPGDSDEIMEDEEEEEGEEEGLCVLCVCVIMWQCNGSGMRR